MPKKRTPPPTIAQIRRETSRLLGAKSQAMRDQKALVALTQPRRKGPQKRAPKPTGIHMGQ